jgi:hypothetical protein
MATTVDPLSHEEEAALVAAAARFEARKGPKPGQFTEFKASEFIAFSIGTGIHPEVYWHPEEHRLRLEREGDRAFVRWNRPKKTGIKAACSVALNPDDEVWVGPFIARVVELGRRREFWCRFVRTIWETTGLPGVCSMRTLRHTSLARVAERTSDPFAVADHGNVSIAVGYDYVRGASHRRIAAIPSVMPKVGAG